MTTEDRVRAALEDRAGGVAVDGDQSLAAIRQRSRRVRRNRGIAALGSGALALVVAVAAVAVIRDSPAEKVRTRTADESTPDPAPQSPTTVAPAPSPTTTESPPTTVVPPTTTTAAAPSPTGYQGIWPPASRTMTDPVDAVESFVAEFVGADNAVAGPFQEGEPGAGEVEVRARAEDGRVLPTVRSTVSVRRFGTAWRVTSAQSAAMIVNTPDALATIASPVTVSGRGRGYEATIRVHVREVFRPATHRLGEAHAMGGCCEELEPFSVNVSFTAPSGTYGAVLVAGDTGREGAIADFTVLPVQFRRAS